MRIGWIGVGIMGEPMASRLLQAGHAVAAYDVDTSACESLAAAGASTLDSPAQVAAGADVIVLSVPGPKEVETVMCGPDGILAAAARRALIIDTTTIGPGQSRRLAGRCRALGIDFLDAPVSGGVASARTGTLTAMVGGDKAAYERAIPVLSCVASRTHYMGASGAGSVAKAVNQMIYLSYAALFCEAAGLAQRAGLDIPELLEVLRASVGGQPLMTGWERRIETGDLSPGFRVVRVLKDLEIGESLCRDENYAAPIFDGVMHAYRELVALGHGNDDLSALYCASIQGVRHVGGPGRDKS